MKTVHLSSRGSDGDAPDPAAAMPDFMRGRKDREGEAKPSRGEVTAASLGFRDWGTDAASRFGRAIAQRIEPLLSGGDLSAAEAARVYCDLRDVRDAVDAALKPFREEVDRLNVEGNARAFEREGVTTITIDGPGGEYRQRVTISTKMRASIRADAKGQAYGWLRNNQMGQLIVDTVNAETLSAAVRHELENGGVQFPEDMFHQYVQTTTSITKVKK